MKATDVVTKAKTIVFETTIRQVVDLFLALTGTTFIQVWQKTDPDMNKTGNRFVGAVDKFNCLNCVTNYSYENMVNNARSKKAIGNLRQAMVSAGVPIDKIEAFFSQAKKDITANAETFKSAGLRWGKYVDNSKCIIEHTPKTGEWKDTFGYYIQVAVMHNAEPVYKWKETGQELTETEIAEMKVYFPDKKEGERQGLDKPYIIRSPRFETLYSISLKGINYRLDK